MSYESLENIGTSVPIVQQEFCGPDHNEKCFRNGKGCQTWTREYQQKYQGDFLYDNLHGSGVYVISAYGKDLIYDGHFYNNSLEGYCQIIYKKGEIFEGLFKQNKPFGPGLRTYIDGTQDVGLWEENRLVRLCCKVNDDWFPRLARTTQGKTKLLKYRKLVPVKLQKIDVAKELLKSLNANEDVLERSDELYNPFVRNQKSIFFNASLYNERFFGEIDNTIEVLLTPEEITEYENRKNEEEAGEELLSSEKELFSASANNEANEDEEEDCCCYDPYALRHQEINEEINRIGIQKKSLQRKLGTLEDQLNYLMACTTEEEEEDCCREEHDYDPASLKKIVEAQMTKLNTNIKALGNIETALLRITQTRTSKTSSYCAQPTKKIVVSDLLAWNNEDLSMRMLKHCFLHRNREREISFDVSSLLSGDRYRFAKTGCYENSCKEFLDHCAEGQKQDAVRVMWENDINPDICDAIGNTGILFAACKDHDGIVKFLVKQGANINVMNDEGVTPLSLTICRYLAFQQGVTNWEKAFLSNQNTTPENVMHQMKEWHPHKVSTEMAFKKSKEVIRPSNSDLNELMSTVSKDAMLFQSSSMALMYQILRMTEISDCNVHTPCPIPVPDSSSGEQQKYLLNTDLYIPPKPKKPKKKKKKKKKNKKSKKSSSKSSKKSIKKKKKKLFKKKDDDFEIRRTEVEAVLTQNKLAVIKQTLQQLLYFGAKPDIGDVPMPVLILAMFTKDLEIVTMLLEKKANPNITTLEENMTALHTLICLTPTEESLKICEQLLKYGANPNTRISPNHWPEEVTKIAKDYPDVSDDAGKTPLQMLCMRYDFNLDPEKYLNKLADLLILRGAHPNKYYLGHTPLTLAILRGNADLVRSLLQNELVDPNFKLEANMGVPLTVLILKRYANILPTEVCKTIYDVLIENKANPLNAIGDFSNCIEFMEEEHKVVIKEKPKKKGKGKGNNKKKGSSSKSSKKKRKGSSKGSKKKKKRKRSPQEDVKDYLVECTKRVLLKHIQCQATRILYKIYEDKLEENIAFRRIAWLVTPKIIADNLQLLLHYNEIKPSRYNEETALAMLDYTRLNNSSSGSKKGSIRSIKHKSASIKSFQKSTTSLAEDLLANLEVKKYPKEIRRRINLEPGMDRDIEKYKVCFVCLKKKGKELELCPGCQLVYFCSADCNEKDKKIKETKHKCGVLFYGRRLSKSSLKSSRSTQSVKSRSSLRSFTNIDKNIISQVIVSLSEVSKRKRFKREVKEKLRPKIVKERPLGSILKPKETVDEGSQILTTPDKPNLVEPKEQSPWFAALRNLTASVVPSIEESSEEDVKGCKKRCGRKSCTMLSDTSSDSSTSDSTEKKRSKKINSKGRRNRKFGNKIRKTPESNEIKDKTTKSPKDSTKKELPNQNFQNKTQVVLFQNQNDVAGGALELDLKKLPRKYRYFIEQIGKCFPELNLPNLLLPYACFSGGQLYYRFYELRSFISRTYSAV